MKKIIIVFGTPCSGKDTHAKMLSKKLGYKYFSYEEVIEEEIKNKTKIGLIMEKYQGSNAQAPDEYPIMLMKEAIISLQEEGIVFNNFPRTIAQAKSLDAFLFSRKNNKPIAIFLDTEAVVALSRIKEKIQEQDSQVTFRKVMDLYLVNTKPTADYYKPNWLEFNTSIRDIESVNEDIVKAVKLI